MAECPTRQQMKYIWRFRYTNMCYGFAMSTIGFFVLFLESTGLSPSQVGIVMAINSFLGAVAPPIWAIVADKIRSRYRVFLLSALMAAIVIGFVPLSTHIRIFGIVLTAFLIPAANFFRFPGFSMLDTMAMEACQRVGGGVEFSSIRVWRSIGFSVMSMIYSPLVDSFGPAIVFYGFVFSIALVFLLRKNLKRFELEHPKGQKSIPLRELQVSRLVKDYYLVIFILINLLMMVPLNCNQYVVYLIDEVGGDSSIIGVINGFRTVSNVLMMFAAPYLKRKIGMPAMMITASVLFMAQGLLYQVCGSTFTILLISMLGGAALGLNVSTGVNYVSLMAPKGLEATAISLYAIGGPTMGIVANAVGGGIVENFGARAIFLFAFGAVCIWLVLFLLSFYVGRRVFKKEPPLPLWPHSARVIDHKLP